MFKGPRIGRADCGKGCEWFCQRQTNTAGKGQLQHKFIFGMDDGHFPVLVRGCIQLRECTAPCLKFWNSYFFSPLNVSDVKLGTQNWKCSAGTKPWAIGKVLREMRFNGMLCFDFPTFLLHVNAATTFSERRLQIAQSLVVCTYTFFFRLCPGSPTGVGADLT